MNFSLVPWRRELERGVQRGITMDAPGRGRGRGGWAVGGGPLRDPDHGRLICWGIYSVTGH